MVTKNQIIVTGANGQLGSELKNIATKYPQFDFQFVDRSVVDLSSPESVDSFLNNMEPTNIYAIINTAAYTAVDKAESNQVEAYQVNANAPKKLAAFAKQHDIKFIHFSTDYVFNGSSKIPYTETNATEPINIYGSTKLAGEQAVLQANTDAVIIRTSWVYSSYGHNFVKTMLRLLHEKPTINVVNDQYGSPTYAYDLADATMQIITHYTWIPGIFHFSNQGIITWFTFAKTIAEFTNATCTVNPITTVQYPTPAKRAAYSVLNTQKIQEVYSIQIKDWKESLRQCLQRIEHNS